MCTQVFSQTTGLPTLIATIFRKAELRLNAHTQKKGGRGEVGPSTCTSPLCYIIAIQLYTCIYIAMLIIIYNYYIYIYYNKLYKFSYDVIKGLVHPDACRHSGHEEEMHNHRRRNIVQNMGALDMHLDLP